MFYWGEILIGGAEILTATTTTMVLGKDTRLADRVEGGVWPSISGGERGRWTVTPERWRRGTDKLSRRRCAANRASPAAWKKFDLDFMGGGY